MSTFHQSVPGSYATYSREDFSRYAGGVRLILTELNRLGTLRRPLKALRRLDGMDGRAREDLLLCFENYCSVRDAADLLLDLYGGDYEHTMEVS